MSVKVLSIITNLLCENAMATTLVWIGYPEEFDFQ